MLPNVEVRLESTIDNELVNNVFMLTLDTKIVPAERDVVEPVNALLATILRPATVD